jgi:hypothetical protein
MVLRLSVPASGGLRVIAADMAARVAEHLDASVPDTEPITDALEQVAARVAPPGGDADIDFEFHRSGGELIIKARCRGQSAELRYPLPA